MTGRRRTAGLFHRPLSAARRATVAVIVTVLVMSGVVMPTGQAAAPAGVGSPTVPTVVIGVAGLTWADVSAGTGLGPLISRADVGSISVRSATEHSCPTAGWLTLSAGADAWADPGPRCPQVPPVANGAVVGWAALQADQRTQHTNAVPGLLGSSLPGLCGFGPGAALAVAGTDGRVARWRSDWSATRTGVAQVLSGCRTSIVDDGVLPAPGTSARAAAVQTLAARVSLARALGARVWLVGIADDPALPTTTRRLQVALRLPPAGAAPQWLSSDSTRRSGIIQIPDLTATLLDGTRTAQPLGGAPVTARGAGHPPAGSAAIIAERLDTDVRLALTAPVVGLCVALLVALQLVALVWLWRRRSVAARRAAVGTLLTMGGFFTGVYLVTATSWWRLPAPAVILAVGLVAISAAVGLGGRRALPAWLAVPVAGAAMLTLAVDGLIGTPLQCCGLYSMGHVTGGRYYGFDNSTFAVLSTAALVLAAAAGTALRRRSPAAAAAAVLAIGGVAVAVDGGPWWGADFGGVITLAPTVLLLAWYVWRSRLSVVAVVVAGVSGLALVTALALVDYSRPPADRTHLGSFVAQVVDGTALDVVQRKADALLAAIDSPLGVVGLLGSLALIGLSLFPRRIPWAGLQRLLADQPLARPLLACIGFCDLVGMLVNDSGPILALVSYGLAVPLLLATVLTREQARTATALSPGAETTVRSGRAVRRSSVPTADHGIEG